MTTAPMRTTHREFMGFPPPDGVRAWAAVEALPTRSAYGHAPSFPPGGHRCIDLGVQVCQLRTVDLMACAVDEHRGESAHPVAERPKNPFDAGRVDNRELHAPLVAIEQAVDPVADLLVLEREIGRQRVLRLRPMNPLTEAHPLEHDLAVLAVPKHGRRVGDDGDLHGFHRWPRAAPLNRSDAPHRRGCEPSDDTPG